VTVSVVIPVYNRVSELRRALLSVLAQTYDDYEVIIVDDNSDRDVKGTTGIIENNKSIRFIKHKTNKGASAARNTGIEAANGKFIAFLDSDDEWKERKLERQVNRLSNKGSASVVYTGYLVEVDGVKELGRTPSKRGYIFEDQLMKDWISPTSTVMVKSECFDEVGKFNTSLDARQDYEMWTRIAKEYKFEYIKEPLATLHTDSKYRITEDVPNRIASHKDVIWQFKDEIERLSFLNRQKVWSTQYYTIARYLQRQSHFSGSIKYSLRSLLHNPLFWKAYIVLVLSTLRIDTNGEVAIRMKNISRRMFGLR
jgi:glycosyltransferase involved in cell wall biosynthesis